MRKAQGRRHLTETALDLLAGVIQRPVYWAGGAGLARGLAGAALFEG